MVVSLLSLSLSSRSKARRPMRQDQTTDAGCAPGNLLDSWPALREMLRRDSYETRQKPAQHQAGKRLAPMQHAIRHDGLTRQFVGTFQALPAPSLTKPSKRCFLVLPRRQPSPVRYLVVAQ